MCALPVPSGFLEEVEAATQKKELGDLELLAAEARGFDWEIEGLRAVGRAQFNLNAFEGARSTWEEVRHHDESDEEANTLLSNVYQRLTDSASQPGSERVLLFTGHMIDAPNRATPRFPANKVDLAKQKIAETVAAEQKSGGIAYGVAGCASGGDILFHQVCDEKSIPTRIFLAMRSDLYIRASVAPAGPQWVEEFNRLLESRKVRVLGESEELPAWLQEKPDYNIWQRNNLWTLHNALAAVGGENVTLIALWNGAKGDGPGGTDDMVQKAQERGAKTIILDTRKIFGL